MKSPKDKSDAADARALGAAVEHHRAGRLAEAEAIYRDLISRRPDQVDALHFLAMIAAQKGETASAVQFISRAIAIRPDVAELHFKLGEISRSAGHVEQAAEAFRRAVELKSNNPAFHNNYGAALAEMRETEKAIEHFRRAVELKADYGSAYSNLGTALRDAGRFGEAIVTIRRSIELQPGNPTAWNNLGFALAGSGQYLEAADAYRMALSLKPDYAKAHFNLSFVYLRLGDYERGWGEYEWRIPVLEVGAGRHLHQTRWNGGDIAGKTVFIYPEQGLGDCIQFLRFIPELAKRGARVIFESPRELARLLGGLDGVERMVLPGEAISGFDFHCPLLSLAGIFGVRANTIPAAIPYLKAASPAIEQWGRRFDPADKRMRVGLVWAGRGAHDNDRNRSMKLAQFSPLSSIENAAFFSLQKGEAGAEAANPALGLRMTDWTGDLTDFSDTAALIANLDLVISVDTSVVHLAGAMGKRVWALLPFVPDWRWMVERADSPWYPSVRLLRQARAGEWDDVVRAVSESLLKNSEGSKSG